LLLGALCAFACGGDDESSGSGASGATGGNGGNGGGFTPVEVALQGALQKGPLIIGSSLDVAILDADGDPTGDVFPTTTINDLGEFEVSFTASGPLSLTGDGFYYNEVTGQVSTAPITLQALHLIAMEGTQSAFVNTVTHLSYQRALDLLPGSDVPTAVTQAETALVGALAIGPAGFDPSGSGIDMNLLGGASLANAYLFAVSAVMAQAAVDAAGAMGSVDGELQELMNAVAVDFIDGTLDPTRAQAIATAEERLIPELALAQLATRLADLGIMEVLPELNSVIDTDGDDVANVDDSCPWVQNPMQGDVLDDVCHAFALPMGADDAGAIDVALGTIDADGFVDAVVIGENSTISFYQGSGDGVFTLAHQEAFAPQDLVLGDFTGDAILDVVAQPAFDSIAVFPGTGSFGALQTPITSASSAGLAPLSVGTIDAGGSLDLFTMNGFGSNGASDVNLPIHVWLNDGSGAMTEVTTAAVLPIGQSFEGPLAHAIADVDGDGDHDVVIAGRSTSGGAVVLVLPGDGSGVFGAAPVITTAALPPSADPMAQPVALITDVSGDGVLDVIYLALGSSAVVLPGTGTTSFGMAVVSDVGVDLTYAQLVASGDFTGDGVDDVALRTLGTIGDLELCVVPSLGGGSFGNANTRVARLLGPGPVIQGAAAADVDNNGAADLFFGAGGEGSPLNLYTMWFSP
jgi:hypothetical protein